MRFLLNVLTWKESDLANGRGRWLWRRLTKKRAPTRMLENVTDVGVSRVERLVSLSQPRFLTTLHICVVCASITFTSISICIYTSKRLKNMYYDEYCIPIHYCTFSFCLNHIQLTQPFPVFGHTHEHTQMFYTWQK